MVIHWHDILALCFLLIKIPNFHIFLYIFVDKIKGYKKLKIKYKNPHKLLFEKLKN